MIRASWTDLRKLRNMVHFFLTVENSYQALQRSSQGQTTDHEMHLRSNLEPKKEYDCIHDGVSIEVVSSVPSFDECLTACDTHNADPLSTSTCTHVRYTPSTAGIVILGGGAQEQDSPIEKYQKIRTENLILTGPKSATEMTHRDVLIRQMIANFLKIQLI